MNLEALLGLLQGQDLGKPSKLEEAAQKREME